MEKIKTLVSLYLDMVTTEICFPGLKLNPINDKQETQPKCFYIKWT